MIVVTAPTSNIGRQVLENVLRGNEAIRVIVRDPAKLPAATRARVEVVTGSHGDADVVARAFAGAASVFWLVPPNLRAASVAAAYVDFTRPACAAWRAAGVARVVGVSALGRGVVANAGFVSASLAMDDLIAGSGVAYRALTMPSFMDNILRQVEPIRSRGLFFGPIARDLKAPTCATRDIAAVAAKLLLDRTWSGNGDAPVLGPEDLSFAELAQIMSEVLGKPVQYQQIGNDAFKARLLEQGASEAMAQGMVDMMAAKNAGLDNAQPRTRENTTPTTFRQWCEEILKPAVNRQNNS